MFKIFMKRCYLCFKKDNNLANVIISGYGEYHKRYYHKRCLHKIQCEPESYDNYIVERAIIIGEGIKKDKIRNKDRLDDLIKSM